MSKSFGNIILAKHFYQKYGANVLRYLIFNSHYNQVINFSKELVQQAYDYTQKIKNVLKRLKFYLYINKINKEEKVNEESELYQKIITSLLNNLNTIKIICFLEQIINFLNKAIDKQINNKELLIAIKDFYFILNILGFRFDLPNYDLEIKLLIKS